MRTFFFHRQNGAALVIVLAFVVLLTALTVAYFSRTTADRQVAQSSFNQSNADQIAASGVSIILGDLRQEIINGSISPAPSFAPSPAGTPYYVYAPTSATNMVPKRSGTPSAGAAIPNLVRRSVRNDSIAAPGFPCRASAINSVTDSSANGRSITLSRWNKHYLIPKLITTGGDASTDPVTSFVPPDWVMVTAEQGAAVLTSPTTDSNGNAVTPVGRYAYAVYDVGGLLDANVAGYPTNSTVSQIGRKGSLTYADLSTNNILPYPISNSSGVYQLDKVIGWRNYATTQPSNNFPDINFAANFQTSSTPATNLYKYIVSNSNGFLGPNIATTPYNNRTDQAFVSRQQLIAFRAALGFSPNALQYLTTYSRQPTAPSWSPPTPDTINPDFRTLRVAQNSTFTRNDGTTASAGEPFAKKRFALQRLNWLTYKGPSATRDGIANNKAFDPDLQILTATFSVDPNYLAKGTDVAQAGASANILKYFGMVWDSTNERWNYIGHPSSPSSASPLASSIATLGTLTATREPDLFELLQGGILNSSLGGSVPSDPALPVAHQTSKILHILTIGANLIAQAHADSYPVRIAFDSGGGVIMEAVGATRMPYLSSLAACALGANSTTAGGVNWFLVPNLWDPFRDTWDLTEATSGTPAYPRPTIRVRVKGGVSFGSVAASSSVKSGSVPSTIPVTIFSSGSLATIDSPLTLASGTTTPSNVCGRDGFLEACRLRTNDISGSVTQFNPPNKTPTTPLFEWNSLQTTGMPTLGPSGSGSQRWLAFRLSLAGSNIPSTAFPPAAAQNPVLILNPGFQITVEYQSPTTSTKWFPYSFLQGNSSSTNNTSIGNTSPTRNLNLVTDYSIYGRAAGTTPTILNSSDATTTTPWLTATLADAPMFAKADPRSIRYNTQIGVVNVTNPPLASASAGIVQSIWPSPYATPPPMIGSTPTPTPTPTPSPMPTPTPTVTPNPPNPATLGDNAIAGNLGNPYSDASGAAWRPIIMNRPFRSVGEIGYVFRDQPFTTLDFSSASSADKGLLDLFTVNENDTATGVRAGVINLNTTQDGPLAAILAHTITAEGIEGGTPGPTPMPNTSATPAATSLITATNSVPLQNKADLANWISTQAVLGATLPKTQREALVRALGENGQTRTWNLLIDVIAQGGRYPPGANNLANFIVEGDQHYWVHVAIDRFTGEVIDRQVEVVNE